MAVLGGIVIVLVLYFSIWGYRVEDSELIPSAIRYSREFRLDETTKVLIDAIGDRFDIEITGPAGMV